MNDSPESISILAVEDSKGDLFLLEEMLRRSPLEILNFYTTDRLISAQKILQTTPLNLVLLDLSLPDSSGIQSYLGIKQAVQRIPTIILTGLSDMDLALEAIKQGAQDYLVKGEFDDKLLWKSISYSLERKRDMDVLYESNMRFKTAAEASNDVIWDWDLSGNHVFVVGDNYRRVFGFEIEHNITPALFWENSLHPVDEKRVLRKLNRFVETASTGVWEDEYRLRKADGTYATVRDRAKIVFGTNNKPVRVIGSIQDLTRLKRNEAAIRASEEKYRLMFYQNPFPTWVFDLDTFLILEVNVASITKYGYEKEELFGMHVMQLYADPADPYSSGPMLLMEQREKPHIHRKKNGELLEVEITSYTIEYFGKKAMQVQVHDISERKRLEKQIAWQEKEKHQNITDAVLRAQESERSTIGRELHDNINQILATSKLYLDMAIDGRDNARDLLMKSRDHITLSIQEIRKLSHALITPNVHEISLLELMRGLVQDIREASTFNIRFYTGSLNESILPEDMKLTIYRIIQEQLTNIFKHAEAKSVLIRLENDREITRLVIADNGKGFDPSATRTGVGISNIISRAGLYEGKVKINSAAGEGCRMEVEMIIPGRKDKA
jgi:PAS domain S-box-containing protein